MKDPLYVQQRSTYKGSSISATRGTFTKDPLYLQQNGTIGLPFQNEGVCWVLGTGFQGHGGVNMIDHLWHCMQYCTQSTTRTH